MVLKDRRSKTNNIWCAGTHNKKLIFSFKFGLGQRLERVIKKVQLEIQHIQSIIFKIFLNFMMKSNQSSAQHPEAPQLYKLSKQSSIDLELIKPRTKFTYSDPRFIYPPIALEHGTNQLKFFQCSYCGFTARKFRPTWHSSKTCPITQHVSFHHPIPINGKPTKYPYLKLIDILTHDLTPIKQWEISKLKLEYECFIDNFHNQLNNPICKQTLKQLKEVSIKNKQLILHVSDQTQQMNILIRESRTATHSLKKQGFQNPSISIERQQNINSVIQTITPSFLCRMKSILHAHMRQNYKLDPQNKQYLIKNLMDSIFKIQIVDSYLGWKLDVDRAVREKISNIEDNKNKKDKRREELRQTNAGAFLKNISYSILRNKRLFVQLFRTQSGNIQIASISLLNSMKAFGCEVPNISNKIIKKSIKKKKKFVEIQDLKEKVLQLKDTNISLACDLFFAFCMAVRLNDLTRIFLRKQYNTYYDYVSLTQIKNKKDKMIVVPRSLKQLIYLSKNQYPIDEKRLTALRQYCYEQFDGFYLLRASCITSVLSGLMKATGFNPHHVTSTTLKYYVNYEDYDLINNIFDLKLNITVPQQVSKRSYCRLHLGQIGSEFKQSSCKKQVSFQAEVNFPSSINLRQQKQFDSLLEQCTFDQSLFKYKSGQTEYFKSKDELALRLLDEETCCYLKNIMVSNFSFFKLLASIIKTLITVKYDDQLMFFQPSSVYLKKAQTKAQNIFDMIQDDECPTYYYIPQKQTSEIAKKIQLIGTQFDRQLGYLNHFDTEEDQISSILKDHSKRKISNQEKQKTGLVVLVKGNAQKQQFAVIKKPSQLISCYRRSERLSSNQKISKFIMTKSQICKLQCKSTLDTALCLDCGSMRTTCQCRPNSTDCNCLQQRNSFKQQFLSNSYILNTSKGIIDEQYKSVNLRTLQNNLKQQVINSKRKYLDRMASSQSIREKIYVPWELVTSKIKQQVLNIQDNFNFLPIQIEKISQQKGYGIKATADIQRKTIIGTYLGVVRSSIEANPDDDSLLSLGWCKRLEYFVCCDQASNYGRFFNGTANKQDANIELRIVHIEELGLMPYFITKTDIQEGQQLQWFYGKLYTYE